MIHLPICRRIGLFLRTIRLTRLLKLAVKVGTDQFLNWLDSVERVMLKAETDAGFYAPGPFKELVEKPKGVISLGAKMGEGWLLRRSRADKWTIRNGTRG